MSPSDPVLTRFAADLRETLETGDSARLSEYLSGRHLPALGNDLTPADVIRRAIQPDLGVTTSLASLLAQVLRLDETEKLDARGRFKLRNIYALAADLPAHAELFEALRRHPLDHPELDHPEHSGEFWSLLCLALTYQQVDDSLEGVWFDLFRASHDNDAGLITAWRGLLWIPPVESSSEVINVDRVEKGLLLLCESYAPGLLQYAIEILCETYPRSSRFWESALYLRVGNWPEDLQEEVFRRWPLLRASSQRATRSRLLAG